MVVDLVQNSCASFIVLHAASLNGVFLIVLHSRSKFTSSSDDVTNATVEAALVKMLKEIVFLAVSSSFVSVHPEGRFSISSMQLQAAGSSHQPPRFTPPSKPVIVDKSKPEEAPRRFISPEFIPPRQRTAPLKFFLERKDMIQRRKVLNIPEFYVGSILSVTTSDTHDANKTNRFVGICTQRSGKGLGATFILRNIIDGQGVEICYELYNPRMKHIEVLKLEKRLDDNLMYLRDALPEYSTFPFDMKPVYLSATQDVPVNERWERPKFNILGIRFDLCLTAEQMEHAQKWAQPWRRFDMLREYDTSELEEKIYHEVQTELKKALADMGRDGEDGSFGVLHCHEADQAAASGSAPPTVSAYHHEANPGSGYDIISTLRSNSSSTTSLASNSPKTGTSDWAVPQSSRLKYRQQFNMLDKLMTGYLSVSFEDKLRENFQRGSMELEKRRQALQEEQRREKEKRREEERREEERRRLKEREEQERREREALWRQKEEEQRIERQREMERRREEERLKELERQEAEERQRRMEWQRTKRVELQTQNEKEKQDIERLTARKRSLELELEAVDIHRQLSRLAPEKQRLTEKLRDLTQTNSTSCTEDNDVKKNKCEKDLSCRKLKEQLDALERETTVKLSEVERYNRDMKDLRERQRQQQAVLEQLNHVKLEKVKELQRRRQEEEEKRRRDEELAREEQQLKAQARLREAQEKAAQQEREEKEKEERRRAEEREKEEREQEEKKRREEKKGQKHGDGTETSGDGVNERNAVNGTGADLQSQLSALVNNPANPPATGVPKIQGKNSTLSTYKALYPFTARNSDELSLEADGLIEVHSLSYIQDNLHVRLNILIVCCCFSQVDESTVREPGWLYGTYQGSSGWFPESYAEKTCKNNTTTESTPAATQNAVPPTEHFRIPRVDIEGPTPTHTPAATHTQHTQAVALCTWTATTDTQLSFSKDDIITVLEQQENWWYGELGENQGWFPKSHVSMVTANNNTHTEPLYSSVDELDFLDSVLLEGEPCFRHTFSLLNCTVCNDVQNLFSLEYVALYTYESPESGDLTFRAEDVILVMEKEGEWWKGCIGDRSGLFPSNYVKPKDSDTAKAGASGKKPVCQVIAMYDYKAANGDEMTFQKGQLINVLTNDDSDWWRGEINGVTGLFPTNYVKMTTESDPSQQCMSFLFFSITVNLSQICHIPSQVQVALKKTEIYFYLSEVVLT
ncbi:Intersectin-2 [Bagarius yarrelli]|uniref:Large ribosomal subunit protein bL19m n=1 Tax=Bagarius yarrelli TaxID=175774 RepID=A0A556U8V2_BAGYA|nr:Intersectin-2 [Bagarius yarrelli]